MDPKYEKLDNDFFRLLEELNKARPEESGDEARRLAITITETEKAYAYFHTFVMHQ